MKKIFTLALTMIFALSMSAQVADPAIRAFEKNDNIPSYTDKNPPANFTQTGAKGEVVIGTGTVINRFPIYASHGYSYSQNIYLASEIGAAANITKLWFYFNGSSLSNSNTWIIYIGHTTKTEFASENDWVDVISLTEVYNGTFTDPGGQGWLEFDITDFAYNGTDNLIIAVDENTPGNNSTSDLFYSTYVGARRSIVTYSDSNNPDPTSPPAGDASAQEAHVANLKLFLAPTTTNDLATTTVTL